MVHANITAKSALRFRRRSRLNGFSIYWHGGHLEFWTMTFLANIYNHDINAKYKISFKLA